MKITLKEGQKIWFTSDTHFSHLNICLGTSSWTDKSKCRNFLDIENMNMVIINKINQYVGEDDILFHLGDFSFNGIENIGKYREMINCKNVHLILGNHDHHQENNKFLDNFYKDPETFEIKRGNIEDNFYEEYKFGNHWDNKVYCRDLFSSVNHYLELEVKTGYKELGKLSSYNNIPPKVRFVLSHYPICSWKDMNQGVIHLFGHVHLPHELRLREGKALDIGVEGNDFYPYELKDIISLVRRQPMRNITIPQDHHQEGLV